MKRLSVTAVLLCFVATVFAQELNVGSVNIRYGAKGDYKKHNGWVERRDYMCSLLNHERFDIFGAQEVLKSQLDDMLERMPEYGYVGVARDDGAEKGEFSPIFYNKSRVKMLKSGTFWLSETPEEVSKGWDGLCRRVCTWALFQDKLTKAKFYHFNTHLDHRGKVAQVEGAKLILAKIAELCPKGANIIITGDFNVMQGSKTYNIFAQSGQLKDCYESAKYRFAPTGTFNGFNPSCYTSSRIDHIFVTEGLKVNRYGVLTYHYYRDINATQREMETSAPVEVKGEDREVKCVSDHYFVQAWITLAGGKKITSTENL